MHYAVADYMPNYRCMNRITIIHDRRAGLTTAVEYWNYGTLEFWNDGFEETARQKNDRNNYRDFNKF